VDGVLLPVEARWEQGNGRVAATGWLGSVLNESVQVAGAYVRGNAVRLVPGMAGVVRQPRHPDRRGGRRFPERLSWELRDSVRRDICFSRPYCRSINRRILLV
jgi:hypothetical protein